MNFIRSLLSRFRLSRTISRSYFYTYGNYETLTEYSCETYICNKIILHEFILSTGNKVKETIFTYNTNNCVWNKKTFCKPLTDKNNYNTNLNSIFSEEVNSLNIIGLNTFKIYYDPSLVVNDKQSGVLHIFVTIPQNLEYEYIMSNEFIPYRIYSYHHPPLIIQFDKYIALGVDVSNFNSEDSL